VYRAPPRKRTASETLTMRLHARIREIRRRLRRLRQPAAVLLVALSCVLVEPLLCIVHCQVAIPWLLRHQHAHQHVHTMVAPASSAHSHLLAAPTQTQPSGFCVHAIGGDPSSGTSVPPSPIHDTILALGVALLGVGLFRRFCLCEPAPRLSIDYSPPTPPPLAYPGLRG
jgi:hypothetical protein